MENNTDEMEMPTLCEHCGEWFDLNDGHGSEKWHPNIIICEKCADEESEEIERDDEIQDLLNQISDAEYTIKDCRERLKILNYDHDQGNP